MYRQWFIIAFLLIFVFSTKPHSTATHVYSVIRILLGASKYIRDTTIYANAANIVVSVTYC